LPTRDRQGHPSLEQPTTCLPRSKHGRISCGNPPIHLTGNAELLGVATRAEVDSMTSPRHRGTFRYPFFFEPPISFRSNSYFGKTIVTNPVVGPALRPSDVRSSLRSRLRHTRCRADAPGFRSKRCGVPDSPNILLCLCRSPFDAPQIGISGKPSQCFPSHSPRKTLSNASFRICLGSVSPATIFSMILSQSAVLISSIRGGSLVVHP
jgi:hypothetical protein